MGNIPYGCRRDFVCVSAPDLAAESGGVAVGDVHALGFGEVLKRLRIEAGLTQEELAETARLSTRTVSDLERGINLTARKETARLLADALGLADVARMEFEALARGRGPADGASAGEAAATRTLPRDIVLFTGREDDLRQVVGVTGSGKVVGIHAIDGMAGVGKTAFAVHAAHQLAPQYPDGQIFLPLHGHTPEQRPVDPAEALASLLLTAGVAARQIPSGLDARMGLWRHHLADKKLLLLLDDAASSEQVRPLLPGASECLTLVTSRRHLVALDDADAISLDILPPGEAALLFVRLAARPGLAPGDPAVAEVVRLCGYLPLAIGLLGRQLHHHPAWAAADLAADLTTERDRLELMAAENLSVAAAFDLSYTELSEGQQRLFRRLGLHPGIDVDGYAAGALDDTGLTAARRDLSVLYDHHLLTEPARGRYRLHDLIREHARALADADPPADRNAAVRRLLDYYLHTARIADQHLARRAPAAVPAVTVTRPAQAPGISATADALAWMSAERLNLHAIEGYAASHDLPGYAIAIPAAMHGFLRTQGYWDQARALHRTALRVARQAGDGLGEASVLTDLGDMQFMTGDYPGAADSLTHALEICRGLGHRLGEAQALKCLGFVQYETGENFAATASLSSALGYFREFGNRFEEASTLGSLAVVQQATGDYPDAIANQSLALALHRDLGNRVGEAMALNFLGAVQHAAGDYAAAIVNQLLALALHRDLGNRFGEANALNHLGAAQQATGDYTAAGTSQEQALRLYRDLGHRMGEANALHSIGALALATGEYATGIAHLKQALELFRDLGIVQGEGEVLNTMGELLLAGGEPAEARARHAQALAIATRIGLPAEEARALEGTGRCLLRDGQRGEAATALRQALEIFRRIEPPRAGRVEATLREHGL
jgi:tetratricopeptide (TPR) repeat protein/transcriptional regulator with XRE-family HTH domain